MDPRKVVALVVKANSPELRKAQMRCAESAAAAAWERARLNAESTEFAQGWTEKLEALQRDIPELSPKIVAVLKRAADVAPTVDKARDAFAGHEGTIRALSIAVQARRRQRLRANRPAMLRRRARERRPSCNARARGSRRVTSRSAGGGSSGDPDDPEPVGGRLPPYWHIEGARR